MATSLKNLEHDTGSSDNNSITDSGSESGASERSLNGARLFRQSTREPENHHAEKSREREGRGFRGNFNESIRWPRRDIDERMAHLPTNGSRRSPENGEGRSQSAPVVRFSSRPQVVRFREQAPVSSRSRTSLLVPVAQVQPPSPLAGEVMIPEGMRKEIGNLQDPDLLRKMSNELLHRAKAIEEEKARKDLEEKVTKFSSSNKVAIASLLEDCYICTEPLLRGLGAAGDFGIASWKCRRAITYGL